MSTPHLTLRASPRAAYGENDELQVAVQLVGASLSGSASLFDDHRQLNWLEEAFSGFPSRVGEEVSFAMGVFARLKLQLSTDAKGRVVVGASLSIPVAPTSDEVLSVCFLSDAAALDSFCLALRSFHPGAECEACLEGRQWE